MPKFSWLCLFSFLIIAFKILTIQVEAAVSSCSASVSPTSVTISTSPNLTFTVNNTSSQTIVWAKFTSPSSNFTVTSASASGWSVATTSSTATFTSGSISAGSGGNFTVATTVGTTIGNESWTVQVSDSSNGTSPTTCSGSTSITVSSSDTTAPTLSNLTVSDISDTSAKISWTTDEATTSTVYYGTSVSYGSTTTTSSATSHSVILSGLTANTTYHYNVVFRDSAGNEEETGDNTFVTSKLPTTTTVTKIETKTETKTVSDTSIPDILITTDLKSVFSKTPKIIGKASDNSGVSKVDYSTDDGRNWLPVDKLSAVGVKSASFEFTPIGLFDDSYKIRARVTDSSGNKTTSKAYLLVIDRLPPQVGATFISTGGQTLLPDDEGSYITVEGVDQIIYLSAIGGPTEINLSSGKQIFSLVKNPDNGLWRGTLSFSDPGSYDLSAASIDGGGHEAKRNLNKVVVLPKGKVQVGDEGIEAEVKVFTKEPGINEFVLWQADSWGQENPQKVDRDGKYKLFLPAGTYFLEVSAPGFKTQKTNIFTLNRSLPITTDFSLEKAKVLSIGSLKIGIPDLLEYFFPKIAPVSPPSYGEGEQNKNLVGKELPFFELDGVEGKVSIFSFRGKNSVLTLLSSWLPDTSEQIKYLEDFQKESNLNVVPIMVQEPISKTSIFQKRGGYKIPLLSDSDGVLIEPFEVHSFPTHVFLDRKGVVNDIKVGVLSKEEIAKILTNF